MSEHERKVLCFGELLLRMSPALSGKWLESATMPVFVGGAELNVASALARWHIPVFYVTALPDNYLSQEVCSSISSRGIDVSHIIFKGDRIGLYFLPQGKDMKNTGVIYDRAHSSYSGLGRGEIDWKKIIRSVSWLHFSAISAALGGNVADVCLEACEAAQNQGVPISMDLNFRAMLWKNQNPVPVMSRLAGYCDVMMGNIWSAANLLGVPLDENIHDKKSKTAYLQHARETALAIMEKFPRCQRVANTFRFDKESGIRYFATLDTQSAQFVSSELTTDQVVDKVGSGDCFMAALIYCMLHQESEQDTVNFAASAAFGKLQEKGDETRQTVATIKSRLSYV